jgi:hypothetical protein
MKWMLWVLNENGMAGQANTFHLIGAVPKHLQGNYETYTCIVWNLLSISIGAFEDLCSSILSYFERIHFTTSGHNFVCASLLMHSAT